MFHYSLRLFIAGKNARSQCAITNIESLKTRENLEISLQIIDLTQNPELADQEKILAIPTLIKDSPTPSQRIIGDLSDYEKLLNLLEVSGRNYFDTKGQE